MPTEDAITFRRQMFLLWLQILATLIGLYLLIQLGPVLVLIIISLFFVATFQPMTKLLHKRLSRKAALTTIVTLIVGG